MSPPEDSFKAATGERQRTSWCGSAAIRKSASKLLESGHNQTAGDPSKSWQFLYGYRQLLGEIQDNPDNNLWFSVEKQYETLAPEVKSLFHPMRRLPAQTFAQFRAPGQAAQPRIRYHT